ncbi:MAG TPA: hypothetical protein VGO07_03060 [Candidatus Saccharimonadales bacterium]|nr:hypothetical protein [Candidatus Saccharimonadales bacterium]
MIPNQIKEKVGSFTAAAYEGLAGVALVAALAAGALAVPATGILAVEGIESIQANCGPWGEFTGCLDEARQPAPVSVVAPAPAESHS